MPDASGWLSIDEQGILRIDYGPDLIEKGYMVKERHSEELYEAWRNRRWAEEAVRATRNELTKVLETHKRSQNPENRTSRSSKPSG